jgi:hypothetical protein
MGALVCGTGVSASATVAMAKDTQRVVFIMVDLLKLQLRPR